MRKLRRGKRMQMAKQDKFPSVVREHFSLLSRLGNYVMLAGQTGLAATPRPPEVQGEEGKLHFWLSHVMGTTSRRCLGYQVHISLSLHLLDFQFGVAAMKFLGNMMRKWSFRPLPGSCENWGGQWWSRERPCIFTHIVEAEAQALKWAVGFTFGVFTNPTSGEEGCRRWNHLPLVVFCTVLPPSFTSGRGCQRNPLSSLLCFPPEHGKRSFEESVFYVKTLCVCVCWKFILSKP